MQKTHKTANKAAYTGDVPNTPLRFLWHTARPYRWLIWLSLLSVILAQAAGSLQSYLISTFVDTLLAATNVTAQLETVYYWGVIFILLVSVTYIGWRSSGYLGAVAITKQSAMATQVLYQHTARHSHSYFTDNFAGSVSNKIAHASDGSSEMLVGMIFDVGRHLTSIVVSGILLAVVNFYLSLGFFVVIAIAVVYNYFLVQKRRPLVEQYSKATTVLRGQMIDIFTNIQATRQYAYFESEEKRVNELTFDRTRKDCRQWHFAQHINVVNNIVALLMITTVVFVTYQLLKVGQATPGEVILVMLSSFTASYSMLSIGEILNRQMRHYGETAEGLEGLLTNHEIVDVSNAKELFIENGDIVWKRVNFKHESNPIFKGFNLSIKSGQRVGLVGPSGAGKTTFVSLLLRQHDIQSGSIEIDGQNIAKVTQDSLREHIAVVPQEPLLFHRSIRENIAYGKPEATEEEIIEVAQKAQAHDFISALPEGYDTLVGERGVKLSGGQKQRIAIARAMLKDAPILVLDEATSALDSESEVAIQKALHELMEGKTVVAIAHRLSTLREMDRIIVLEKGKIVEDGTHATLSKGKGTYARLWAHQAGGFLQD